jgi:cob(I)alamin adenosyltransferase
MEKGYIQVYTGNGKGKTTAALGLSIRAAGANKKIFFAQFMKKKFTNEMNILKKIANIDFKQYGPENFIFSKPTQHEITVSQKAFEEIKNIILSNKYNIIVLDEINVAVHLDLIDINDMIELIKNKPENTELILTGRYAHKKIIEIADLVTEMNCIKHYFDKGVKARKGIEN